MIYSSISARALRLFLATAAGLICILTGSVSSAALINNPPVANAGGDKVLVSPQGSVDLTGSGSDSDGSIVSYQWVKERGGSVTMNGDDTPTLSLSGMAVGFFRFSLTVTDNNGASDTDEVWVFVRRSNQEGVVTGELKKWHRATVTFDGPNTNENANPNPFTNYRLVVAFTHIATGETLFVNGFYAADGNAGQTGASSGNKWRAHLCSPKTGEWSYMAFFSQGSNISIDLDLDNGNNTSFHKAGGSMTVTDTDKTGRDFRGKGRLQYVGKHHLQFAETGEYFLKAGADSPENFLAYYEFDGTVTNKHHYDPHYDDYADFGGGPTWRGGKGKRIIGAINYLASTGMNSAYMLTHNVNGDGDDVWPWINDNQYQRYDVSKLDQWEMVFGHMTEKGVLLHFVTQETENDGLLDGGSLGNERKLYYRELMARFGHHPAIKWNLGEEWDRNPTSLVKQFHDYLEELDFNDQRDMLVAIHTYPGEITSRYRDYIEDGALTMTSLQHGLSGLYDETVQWREESAAAGIPWVVEYDEQTPAGTGTKPDANDYWHDSVRKDGLWGNLIAGGAGIEYYFGYSYPNDDLDCEDWRSREHMFQMTDYAISFFHDNTIPFWDMEPDPGTITGSESYCLQKEGEVYVGYLEDGGNGRTLDLGNSQATFNVKWYDPRYGGGLQNGTVTQITGPGRKSLGNMPNNSGDDWVVLVTKENQNPFFNTQSITDPIDQPSAVTVAASVDDPDGLDDIAHVQIFFFSPSGYFTWIPLTDQGDGNYSVSVDSVTGLEAGSWHFIPVVIDQSGGRTVGGMTQFTVQ